MRRSPKIRWVVHGHDEPSSLWPLLGPLATSKAVHKDLGGPVLSTDSHRWWFAVTGDSAVAMASLCYPRGSGQFAWFDNAWVAPDWRGLGVWSVAFGLVRDEAVSASMPRIRACVSAPLVTTHERRGFKTYLQRGRWSYMELFL